MARILFFAQLRGASSTHDASNVWLVPPEPGRLARRRKARRGVRDPRHHSLVLEAMWLPLWFLPPRLGSAECARGSPVLVYPSSPALSSVVLSIAQHRRGLPGVALVLVRHPAPREGRCEQDAHAFTHEAARYDPQSEDGHAGVLLCAQGARTVTHKSADVLALCSRLSKTAIYVETTHGLPHSQPSCAPTQPAPNGYPGAIALLGDTTADCQWGAALWPSCARAGTVSWSDNLDSFHGNVSDDPRTP
ncbi:hypothetical protein C8R46DRAFT_1035720 [Mycena filopes]|nr:hypothetical protein C8R46DRAFT_1035720 [Mycena filopes]